MKSQVLWDFLESLDHKVVAERSAIYTKKDPAFFLTEKRKFIKKISKVSLLPPRLLGFFTCIFGKFILKKIYFATTASSFFSILVSF